MKFFRPIFAKVLDMGELWLAGTLLASQSLLFRRLTGKVFWNKDLEKTAGFFRSDMMAGSAREML